MDLQLKIKITINLEIGGLLSIYKLIYVKFKAKL